MNKAFYPILLLCLLTLPGRAEKVAVFPELYKVNHVAVDDDQIYISQEFKIFIYSLKDYKLIKTFGTKGDGPREIRGFVKVVPGKNRLIITSSGKISFFSKQGEYLNEIKSQVAKNGIFIPLGKGFVSPGYTPLNKGVSYRTIDLFNGQLKKIKEIFRYQDRSFKNLQGRRFNLMAGQSITFQVDNNKILINQPDGSIFIFNKDARLITTIRGKYPKLEFTEKHKQALIERTLSANPGKRGSYNEWGKMLAFPSHFPPIQLFQTSEQKVYVLTHKRIGQKGECFIYDLQGKLLKQTMVPVFDFSPREPYPLAFYKGTLYQVCENEETEEWQLHITKIL